MKKHQKKNNPELSIIILSYNTKELLDKCLSSLKKHKSEAAFEVIVVDNASEDGSTQMVEDKHSWVKLIKNDSNIGFSAGNNTARDIVNGKYILFLNSDTEVLKNTLKETLGYMDKNPDVGGLTCKLVLPNGMLDKDTRRSYPTPWVSFSHLVLPLDKLMPNSGLFAKYWYTYKDEDEVHEVDVLQGAYFLTRKQILDKVGWFDEDYFLDGEDIDLSWKIKNEGYKIIYFPKVETIHYKGASKGKNDAKKRVSLKNRLKFKLAGVNSMEIFYKKRLWKDYPLIVNLTVIAGIKTLKIIRTIKESLR